MIRDYDKETCEFRVDYGFELSVDDSKTAIINGEFDRNELSEAVAGMGFSPDDIFQYSELKEWAIENGFVEEE